MAKPPTMNRYPGIRPFSPNDEKVFFGREQEIEELSSLLKLERIAVLHGKSGIGKSSLLQAALIPNLTKNGKLLAISLRFGAFTRYRSGSLLDAALEQIKRLSVSGNPPSLLAHFPPSEQSFWYLLKKIQLENPDSQGFLFIIDQAEEIFTYPSYECEEFNRKLAGVQGVLIPKEIRAILRQDFLEAKHRLSEIELEQLFKPLNVKLLFSIRSDRLSLLGGFLPGILQNLCELKPFSPLQARQAIEEPAKLPGGAFTSPAFRFQPEAVDVLLGYLTDAHSNSVDPLQLQMVCSYLEQLVVTSNVEEVNKSMLGDLNEFFENFYERQLNIIPAAKQEAVRRFIEEGLIYEEDERRLSLHEGQVNNLYGVGNDILNLLSQTNLIRAEASMRGGTSYELSHDTLVTPILKAKHKRLENEHTVQEKKELSRAQEEARTADQRADKERQLRSEAEKMAARARQRTRLAIVAMSLTLVLAALAVWKFMEANEQRQEAQKQTASLLLQASLASERDSNIKKNTSELFELDTIVKNNRPLSEPKEQKLLQTINRLRNASFTIFIMYQGKGAIARKSRIMLKKEGFTVPIIDSIASEYPNSIRYFNATDKEKANEVRALLLREFASELSADSLPPPFFSRMYKAPVGQIEIWFD